MSSVISNLLHKCTGWQAFTSIHKHESIFDHMIFSLAEDMKLWSIIAFQHTKQLCYKINQVKIIIIAQQLWQEKGIDTATLQCTVKWWTFCKISLGSIKQAYDQIGSCQASVGANENLQKMKKDEFRKTALDLWRKANTSLSQELSWWASFKRDW